MCRWKLEACGALFGKQKLRRIKSLIQDKGYPVMLCLRLSETKFFLFFFSYLGMLNYFSD